MVQPTIQFNAEHPVFGGHFPGNPIVPGVLLLDWAHHEIEKREGKNICGAASAKFHSPAAPGERLHLDYHQIQCGFEFEIRCAQRKIASGRFISADSVL